MSTASTTWSSAAGGPCNTAPLIWSTDAGGLDVLQLIPGLDGRQLGYAELRQHATNATDDGRVFAVASLADITASKRATGRQKDLEALPELDRLLAENPPSRDNDGLDI